METSKKKRCSLCIFCLKPTDNSTENCDKISKSDQYRFFTLIVRHFLNYGTLISADKDKWCRNACKVISEITINGDDNEPFFENVQICGNCEGICRKFSDLYHQMKELELRIDWEVGKLRDVMDCADKVVSKREKDGLERKFTNGGVVTLGEFRNTLKQSCEAYQEIKKKLAVPKVKLIPIPVQDKDFQGIKGGIDNGLQINSALEQYRNPPSSSEVQEFPMQPEGHDDDDEYHVQPEVGSRRAALMKGQEHENGNEEEAMDVEYPVSVYPVVVKGESNMSPLGSSEEEQPIILPEEDPLNPSNSSHSTYTCSTLTCALTFTSKFELFQHNVASHIGKYFSSVQQRDMPNGQFNNDITQLLETTLDTFYKVDENYQCSYCPNLFLERQKARNHLIVQHRQILKEKFVEAQKSEEKLITSLQNIKREIADSSGTDDTDTTTIILRRKKRKRKHIKLLICSTCSCSFSNKRLKFQHNMSNHPEKFFLSVKPESLTPHQFQIRVANMLNRTLDELEKVDSRYQCDFCSKLLSGKQCAKNHLVRKHCSNLKKKLVQTLGSGTDDSDTSVTTFRRRKSKKQLGCSTCSRSFPNKCWMFQHNMSNHPEKFFLSVKPESLTPQQFQICVANMLSKTVEGLGKIDEKFKCDFCIKILSGKECAKNHLVRKHRSDLKEKLIELQQSGSVSVVSRINTSGMTKILGNWNGKKSDYMCNICDKKFIRRFLMNQHHRYNHPEKFFEMLKSSSENNKLFKTYVHYVLEKQRECGFSDEEDDQVKCDICSKVLSSVYNAKSHLISKHRDFLAEKLEEVQQSGISLHEMEKELRRIKMKGAKLLKKKLTEETDTESD